MESVANINIIGKINESPYLTRQNLELLLGSNRRTLDYRIASLSKNGDLIKIKSGFYLSNEYLKAEEDNEKYLEYIGCVLKEPSYVSLRYALAKYNLIPESIFDITYVTTKKTDRFNTPLRSFSYNNITEKLYFGYKTVNYKNKMINIAYPYKAIFDLFYYSKLSSIEEVKDYVKNSRINWGNLDKANKIQLKKILFESNLKKMTQLLEVLKIEKII